VSTDAVTDGWVDDHADELIEVAQALVRTATENWPPTGNERGGQRLVAQWLAEAGAEVDVFSPADVIELASHPAYFGTINGQPRDGHDRPNVVGRFRGEGGGRSIVLSTHIDTVPGGDPDHWKVGSPFGGEIVDGRLYGRGSYDTKCAFASHLIAIRCLRELGVELGGDVIVETVVDEEYGGSHGVLASRLRGYNADLAINSEPTHMAVCPEHRGGREAFLRFTGDAGMAFGGEQQRDPIVGLARAIAAMRAFDEARNREPTPELYRSEPGLPLYFNQIGGGGTTYAEAVGTPDSTYLHFWAETYAGTTAEQFDDELLRRVHAELDAHDDTRGQRATLDRTIRFMPGSSMPLDHPGLGVVRASFDGLAGREYEVKGAPFACDAYVFNLYSPTPALIIGPGGGGAHAPDEYVEVDDLIDLAKLCARLLRRWCG
jgi:acetylornithine deacetylase